MTEERDWRNEVLQQADFDKEYGMLAYTLAEVQNAAKPATTAVQNYIAAKVVERFHAAYDNYAKTYNPNTAYNRARTYGDRVNAPMRYDEYFARNRQAYLDVLSQPIDLTLAGMTRDTYGNASPGELFPTAFNQTTVGGAMNWLTMSEVPGMLTSLAKPIYGKHPSLMGPDGKPVLDDDGHEVPDPNRQAPLLGRQASTLPADELNAAWMRGYETIHLYKPGNSNNFTVWFNAQAKKGIEFFREAEKAWRSGSTPMSYAFNDDGDSDEGGNYVDMNTGEYTDGGMMAGENAGAIGDVSRFSTLSKMPMSKSTGAPINVLNAFLNLQTQFADKDSKQPWTTFNVQTGRYGHNPDAKTLQVWGIDPNSPAAKAGMKEGAFIASLSRLLEDPELPILVDALQNGQPLNIAVRQQNKAGEWVGQVLTIQPGSMAGRGIDDFEEKKPHWIENLADFVDRSSMKGIETNLFTTSERYASGMFQDKQGYWHISPMSRTQSEEYSVPVALSPQALRQFIPLYEEQKKAWKQYDQLYNYHYQRAYQTQLDRYIKANHTGTKLQTPFLDAVREMTLKTLPRDIPRPGTELYQIWQSGQGMLGEIRDFEDNINGAPSSGDFYDRTIEQWDAWASSMERFKNPGVYGAIDLKRLALAQREVSGAGNYLQRQKDLYWENAENPGPINPNPGGARLGKTLRPDPETGELKKYYPPISGSEPEITGAIYPQQHTYTLEGWQFNRQRKRLAGKLANYTPQLRPRHTLPAEPDFNLRLAARDENYADRLYTVGDSLPFALPDSDNGTFTPGADPSTRSSVLFGVGEWEGATMSGAVSGHLYPRAEGRIARRLVAEAERARVGAPAPDYLGNPTTGPILPSHPEGKYKEKDPEPLGPLPTGEGRDHFPNMTSVSLDVDPNAEVPTGSYTPLLSRDERANLEQAAYSHISNTNAVSAFPLGSMNEDEWVDRDGNRNTEDIPEVENTYDGSVLGGDMNTPEMEADLNELDKHWVDKKGNKHYFADNRTRVVDSQGGTPIYDRETREIIGYTPSYGEQRVNTIGQQAALPRKRTGERKLMGPFPADLHKDQLRGVEATNYDTTDDTIKARQEFDRSHPDRVVDAEMEGVSDEIMQGESENRFQQAWKVLFDPKRAGASLSEIVSSAGNMFGFLAHSKADWGQIFQNFSQNDGGKSYSTYYALQDGDKKMQALADELEANIGGLTRADRKRAVVLSRLGETPELAADMHLGRNKRQGQYYREALKQVAGEVKKRWGIDLSVGIGEEETFFNQLKDLRKTNAEAFQMVKGAFAPLADQLKASRKWVSQMNTVPGQPQATPAAGTGNTPAPQRTQQDPGDSHVFRGPDGKGRAMLKWSPNQVNEMRRGRRSGIDPVTGEFDPLAMENTPVSAQLAARGGGSSRRNFGFSIPDYEELSPLQNSIAYRHFDAREGDNQRARLGGQVQTYVENYMDHRKRFDLIMPYDADSDQDGTALQSMLQNADAAVRGAFGQGFDIGEMEEVADPDLPAGFVRVGASVRREGEGPEYVNDFAHDPDPGEPPEAPPPPDQTPPGGGNGNNNGQPPTEPPPPNPAGQADHDPSGTPRPNRSNGSGPGRTPKPKPNTDPAAFPMQPGAEGWKMTFTRYNPQTGKGKSVQVWGRKDADGNLGWYERNAQGQMEPLQVNKGWGRIYDEKGALLHEVDRNAREYYDAMNSPTVSSDGNTAAGNNTATPARSIIRTPEEWAAFTPEAGMMMIDRSRGGGPRHYFAVEDLDNTGQMKWVTSAKNGGIQEDAPNPGWGQIVTKDGQVIADVPQHKYEIYANEQGLARSAENKRLREQARIESEKRNAEIKEQRRIANTTPPPSREGFSASFGRFNNAMWEISGQNVSKFLRSHSPTEFGESEIGENTKLAAMNEYLGQVTHLYNSYIDKAPASADEIMADIMDMTGASEEKARPIAEALFQEHEQVRLRRKAPLAKQNPMKRSMEIAGRLNDAYDSQDIGRGPLGMRSHIQNLAQDVSVRDIDGFHSPSLGEGAFYPYIDAKGEQRYVPRIAIDKVNPQTGETGFQTTANENQIAKGLTWAQNAFNSAFSGELPSSPDAILATLKERMYTAMNKQMKAEVENAVAHGQDRLEAGSAANIIKEIGDHFIQKIVGKVKKGLDETVGEANSGAVAEGTRYDTRIKTLDDLKAKLASDPVFAAEFRGKSAEEIHAGDEMVVYDSNKRSFKVGGSGDDHYGTKSKVSSAGNRDPELSGTRGMFGKGSVGSIMYGAYMLKREWQMATGATFAAANTYGEGMADYAGLMYSGSPLAGTDVGFAYRQEVGESFMGKAAYSQWGAFMDIPYRLSESGNLGAARLLQTAGIAGGLAMGGAIGGSMLAGTALVAAAPVLATGGLVLGGALLAGTAAMEAYNAFNPEDAQDLTLSTIVSETEKENARNAARARRKEALYGPQTAPSGVEMSAVMLAGGSNPHSPQGVSAAWAARTEMNKYDNNKFVTDEELMEYMTPEEKQLWIDEEMNKKAEDLAAQVREIRGNTLEDKNTLIKGLSAQKWYMGSPDPQMLGQVSEASAKIGVGSDQSITEGATYAQQLGYLQGTPDFVRSMYKYALTGDRTERARMQYSASRINQFGSQIQAVMGRDGAFAGQGARIVDTYGLDSQQQVGALTSMASGMQGFGAQFSLADFDQMAGIVRDNNPFVANVIGNAMEGFMSGGGSAGAALDFGSMMSSVGMSTQDASIYQRMMQGDLHAYSYQAWQSGNMGNAFFDRAGRPIVQSNGAIAMQVYNNWAVKPGMGMTAKTSAQFLGINGTPTALQSQIISAFDQGGFWGIQKLANQKAYEASMASIGVQLKGIALSENFYWGANQGGTWDNPAAHSAWGIEDRLLGLQHQSTMAGFQDQWTRMTLSNQYAIRREDNQFQRMQASQNFQNWQWSYSYNQFQQSQQWAQDDWQYQDTMRGLSFGWQMEDLNEQIRFASGRQRKQLIRQRDRAALTHNIEDEQIETQRDRQKELWAQQEEQYQKQREYNLELQRLDQESFALNREQREEFYKLDVQSYERRVKEYEEEKKLQDELRELQRKFQYDQLQLQKEAAGAQAAAAAAQKEFNDRLLDGQKNWDELVGTVEQMNNYNNAFRIANATNEMMRMIDNVNVNKINKILELIRTIGTVDNPRYGGERD